MAFVRPYPRCGKARDTFSGLDTDARVPSLRAEGYSIRHRRRIPHSPADPGRADRALPGEPESTVRLYDRYSRMSAAPDSLSSSKRLGCGGASTTGNVSDARRFLSSAAQRNRGYITVWLPDLRHHSDDSGIAGGAARPRAPEVRERAGMGCDAACHPGEVHGVWLFGWPPTPAVSGRTEDVRGPCRWGLCRSPPLWFRRCPARRCVRTGGVASRSGGWCMLSHVARPGSNRFVEQEVREWAAPVAWNS